MFRTIISNFLSMIIIKKNDKPQKENENEKGKGKRKSSKNIIIDNEENTQNNEENKEIKETLNIHKYDLFVFNLILQLPPEITTRGYFILDEKTEAFMNKISKQLQELYSKEKEIEEFDLFFNSLSNADNEDDFYQNYFNEDKVFKRPVYVYSCVVK